jgi:pimeloyl-ACP methyl ester carboxylesterase
MAHGLGGVKEMRLDAFAERFAAAGYICLVFDYRYFGTSGGTPRQWLSIRRQREDWRAAVATARTLDGADPDRVIVWGTSFGGGHVAVTAAEDPRIVAAVAQCPFTSGLASSLAIPTLTAAKIGVRAVRDLIAAFRDREPVTVAAYGPPGSTALMTAPDVVAGCEAIIPDDLDLANAITARFGLDIIRDFPGRRFRDVQCPVHITICTGDTVAPAGPSTRYARQAPHGEVAFADANHVGIYVGEAFEENVARQLDFLTRTVPAVPAVSA